MTSKPTIYSLDYIPDIIDEPRTTLKNIQLITGGDIVIRYDHFATLLLANVLEPKPEIRAISQVTTRISN
jgi:hypothetical protein